MSRSLHWFWSVLTTVVFTEALSDVSSIDLSKNRMTNDKIVIAHRGASGYLPEHTIPAYTFAVAQGADAAAARAKHCRPPSGQLPLDVAPVDGGKPAQQQQQ